MMRAETRFLAALVMGGVSGACAHGSDAQAACVVVGDSIGVGVGQALRGVCATSAKVGLSSAAVAARVTAGHHWTIASLGSNDFPRGISPAQRTQSESHVRNALASVAAKAGGRLLLILPANGARPLVEGWAGANGIPTVRFTPGRDGIHPRDYASLARDIRSRIGN